MVPTGGGGSHISVGRASNCCSGGGCEWWSRSVLGASARLSSSCIALPNSGSNLGIDSNRVSGETGVEMMDLCHKFENY